MGERLNMRVNVEIISRHNCVLVVGLESVLVKGHERAFPECVHILRCVDDVKL